MLKNAIHCAAVASTSYAISYDSTMMITSADLAKVGRKMIERISEANDDQDDAAMANSISSSTEL